MIKGTKRPLDNKAANRAELRASIHNRFDIEVVDAKTGEVKQRAQAENVICDSWWNRLSESKAMLIAFGSGAGTPSASDTTLFQQVGAKSIANTTYNKIDQINHVASVTRSVQLTESEYVGKTLTEVGLATSSGAITTHAMLQDMNGNQINILKTDTDIINIYATVYAHWKPTYNDGSVVVSAEVYEGNNLVYFLCGGTMSGDVFYRAQDCGVSGFTNDSVSAKTTYDSENRAVHIKIDRIPVGSWNLENGIPVLYYGKAVTGGTTADREYWTYPMITFYPESFLQDTSVTGEAIGTGDGVTVDFKTKFSPAYDIEVLVDGVPATDVTTGENLPVYGSKIGRAFRFLPSESEVQPYPGSDIARRRSHGIFNGNYAVSTSALLRGVYYNPYYQYGVTRLESDGMPGSKPTVTVEVSDDLKTWTTIFNATAQKVIEIPEAYQNSKYWAVNNGFSRAVSRDIPDTNIHFSTPPAEGVVIVANYKTKCLAKDENHVFDFEFSIYLGEYTE